jgi:tRNA pseudouridine55 synthase
MIWLENEFDFAAGCILNFNKPEGKSSFWIVKQVRSIVQTKVGHAGTLDPFATGVLVLCTGKATKKIKELMELPKTYIGEIQLGKTTNTDDITGKILYEQDVPELNLVQVKDICDSFIGDIWQTPPMFSAKKIKGKRLYKIALAGEVITRTPNLVHIDNIDVLSFNEKIIRIKVKCSKGTYIRALASDIGNKIGCGAFLKTLTRSEIGNFNIEKSLNVEQFREIVKNYQPSS